MGIIKDRHTRTGPVRDFRGQRSNNSNNITPLIVDMDSKQNTNLIYSGFTNRESRGDSNHTIQLLLLTMTQITINGKPDYCFVTSVIKLEGLVCQVEGQRHDQ